jgi:hypothetical protein
MVSTLYKKVVAAGTRQQAPVPELTPWREVGWIFRDGEVIAIERQGTQTRMRTSA